MRNPILYRTSVILCAVFLLLPVGCLDRKFYSPNRIIYETPDQYALVYEDISFRTSDETRLWGWFIPAAGEPLGTVIYFPGNFANITHSLKQIHWLPEAGFNVFTFDYRGYGRSEGTPGRFGIQKDATAALSFARARFCGEPCNLFLFGQSIGGAIAIAAAAENPLPEIRAVVAEGTFSSYRSEARHMMAKTVREQIGNIPCLSLQLRPFSWLTVSNAYSPVDRIDRISPIPVLLIHCIPDTYVPVSHSERLYQQAEKPKYLWLVDGCRHIRLFTDEGKPAYRKKLIEYFKTYRVPEPASDAIGHFPDPEAPVKNFSPDALFLFGLWPSGPTCRWCAAGGAELVTEKKRWKSVCRRGSESRW